MKKGQAAGEYCRQTVSVTKVLRLKKSSSYRGNSRYKGPEVAQEREWKEGQSG